MKNRTWVYRHKNAANKEEEKILKAVELYFNFVNF